MDFWIYGIMELQKFRGQKARQFRKSIIP